MYFVTGSWVKNFVDGEYSVMTTSGLWTSCHDTAPSAPTHRHQPPPCALAQQHFLWSESHRSLNTVPPAAPNNVRQKQLPPPPDHSKETAHFQEGFQQSLPVSVGKTLWWQSLTARSPNSSFLSNHYFGCAVRGSVMSRISHKNKIFMSFLRFESKL